MPKPIKLKDIVLPNARLTKEAIEDGDFDTGCVNGSGKLTIRASSAVQYTKRSVIFYGVEAEAENAEGKTYGYGSWPVESLQSEAEEMLRKDYCK